MTSYGTAFACSRGQASQLALAVGLLCASCHSKAGSIAAGSPEAVASSSASATPVDRLAPDELAAGTAEVWGFIVPREMQVEHRYQEVAHLVGSVKPDALAN